MSPLSVCKSRSERANLHVCVYHAGGGMPLDSDVAFTWVDSAHGKAFRGVCLSCLGCFASTSVLFHDILVDGCASPLIACDDARRSSAAAAFELGMSARTVCGRGINPRLSSSSKPKSTSRKSGKDLVLVGCSRRGCCNTRLPVLSWGTAACCRSRGMLYRHSARFPHRLDRSRCCRDGS